MDPLPIGSPPSPPPGPPPPPFARGPPSPVHARVMCEKAGSPSVARRVAEHMSAASPRGGAPGVRMQSPPPSVRGGA